MEVLVALVILSISFGVVFETLSQSKRLSWKSEEVVEAARVAHNLLSNPAFIQEALREGALEGTVPQEERWHFSALVSPLELDEQETGTPREIPSMVKLKVCLYSKGNVGRGPFCITRWCRR